MTQQTHKLPKGLWAIPIAVFLITLCAISVFLVLLSRKPKPRHITVKDTEWTKLNLEAYEGYSVSLYPDGVIEIRDTNGNDYCMDANRNTWEMVGGQWIPVGDLRCHEWALRAGKWDRVRDVQCGRSYMEVRSMRPAVQDVMIELHANVWGKKQ